MRLIDAEFEEAHYTSMLLNPTPDVTAEDKRKAQIIIGALKMAKTVDALPSADRPTGKWEIEQDTDEYGMKRPMLVCSKCKKEPAAWDLTELFEFCPNCGTKMEGDTE